jgi:hypothetical protein
MNWWLALALLVAGFVSTFGTLMIREYLRGNAEIVWGRRTFKRSLR